MQAIILAAGMGKRLGALTKDNTKCMIKVNGVTLIDRLLIQLSSLQLSRVVIVVGYKGDKLREYMETVILICIFSMYIILYITKPIISIHYIWRKSIL